MSDGKHEAAHPDELVIEVDGENVHVATMDATRVLEFAIAYLELLGKCADDRDEVVEFRGFRVFEKCASLATVPNDQDAARRAVVAAGALLASPKKAPHGFGELIGRVRAARAELPADYRASVKLADHSYELVTEPGDEIPPLMPVGMTVLRAYVQRVGGAAPRATFWTASEKRSFTLDVEEDLAARLGKHLYKTVDIEARLVRNGAGLIESGRLHDFYTLNATNPAAAWREWFRENAVDKLIEDVDNSEDQGGGDGRPH